MRVANRTCTCRRRGAAELRRRALAGSDPGAASADPWRVAELIEATSCSSRSSSASMAASCSAPRLTTKCPMLQRRFVTTPAGARNSTVTYSSRRCPVSIFTATSPRAGRGRGPDHSVERRAGRGGLEAGAGARRGLLDRAQTGRAVDPVGVAARSELLEAGIRPGRSISCRAAAACWGGARRTSRRRQDRLHGLDGRRQATADCRAGQPQAPVARAGRQVADADLRRRRSRRSDAGAPRRSSPTPGRCASPARGSMRSARLPAVCAGLARVASTLRLGPGLEPIRSWVR